MSAIFATDYTYANYIWRKFLLVRVYRTGLLSSLCILILHEETNSENHSLNETYN
jgi:hypothetical protein